VRTILVKKTDRIQLAHGNLYAEKWLLRTEVVGAKFF
jgi:hypothetical protein